MTQEERTSEPSSIDLPCPFCGSRDSVRNGWHVDDGEVEAVECLSCYAGAPVDAWNQRVQP